MSAAGGAHFVHQFLRAACIEVAAEQAADFGSLGVEGSIRISGVSCCDGLHYASLYLHSQPG
jgi:hypothetical protein